MPLFAKHQNFMRLPILATLLFFAACQSPEPTEKAVPPAEAVSPEVPAEKDHPIAHAIDPDWLIVPGKSAGKTEIGATLKETTARLGKPDAGDAAMQHYVSVWYSNKGEKTGNSVAVLSVRDAGNDPEARIKQIRVNSPQFRTAGGIGRGSTLDQIKAQFSITPTNRYTELDKAYTLFDSDAGIGFEVEDSAGCTSIIVHRANEPFSGTYLDFR